MVGLAALTGNERFAWDAYRRLINMYGDVVMGVDHHHFEAAFDRIKKSLGVTEDTDVPAEGLRELCQAYKDGLSSAMWERLFQLIPSNSWNWRSRRCSAVGTVIEPTPIDESTKSRGSTARRSMSRRWSLETWARTRGRASRSHETPRPARTSSTASS